MKKASLLLPLMLVTSCATMQSHKNVEISDSLFQGYELSAPQYIYQDKQNWYLALQHFHLKKHYPLFRDTVFLENEPIRLSKASDALGVSYHRISNGTAKVLLNQQGYAQLELLQQELQASNTAPQSKLSHPQRHRVRAQFAPKKESSLLFAEAQPISPPSRTQRNLAGLDWLFIDSLGTLGYNIAIPFMAPYYFFKNIANDEAENPFL